MKWPTKYFNKYRKPTFYQLHITICIFHLCPKQMHKHNCRMQGPQGSGFWTNRKRWAATLRKG